MNTINSVSSGLSGALGSGLAGLATSSQQLSRDAQQIANPDSTTTTAALVDSSQTLETAQAAADVVKTSSQLLGSLLDAFA